MIRKIFSISLTVLIVIAVFVFLSKNQSILVNIKTISIVPLIMVFLFQVTIVILNILINKLIFLPAANIRWEDCHQSTIISTILNCFLPMKLGSTYQAVYLKKKYGLPLSWFTGTFIITFLLTILLACMCGLIVMIKIFITKKIFSWLFFGLYLLIVCFIFLLFFLNKFFLKFLKKTRFKFGFLSRIKSILEQITDGIESLKKNKKIFLTLTMLSFLYIANYFLITFFEFKTIGLKLEIDSIILFTSLSLTSILFNVTPGALGIREFLQYIFSSIIGINSDQIIIISIIDRSLLLVALIVLFLIMVNFGFFKKIRSI